MVRHFISRFHCIQVKTLSVGARVDDEGLGGPLWSPAGWGVFVSTIGIKLKNIHMEATGMPHATPRAGASPARTLYDLASHFVVGYGPGLPPPRFVRLTPQSGLLWF